MGLYIEMESDRVPLQRFMEKEAMSISMVKKDYFGRVDLKGEEREVKRKVDKKVATIL